MPLDSKLPFERLEPVTFLPNRQQFTADIEEERPQDGHCVMITLTDAVHFNGILRALGHDYSDDFIRAGAARIRGAVPPALTVYHVSILSFCFVIKGDPEPLIAAVLAGFSAPLLAGGVPISTRAGIGVTACGNVSAADMLRTSLAAAQDSRKTVSGWARYDSLADTAHRRGFFMLSQLTAAMEEKNQLSLHFQPKYDLGTGQPTSAEALIRWQHPSLGHISPAEFIPLAEATDYIHPLTNWVLGRAMEEAARWQEAGLKLRMAVNVSPHNLSRRGFAAHVAAVIRAHGVRPESFEFEFTEGALAANNPVVLAELAELRAIGCKIALDDFGTGFSNFSYITHLPADIIKIDQSFIRRIDIDERSGLVVRAIIHLAHRLSYSVVAEGIETADTYQLLKDWRCDEGQGYFMSRPLDAVKFGKLMLESGQLSVVGGK
jgi:EAL domain-containing protein (putative c-di-GMP-specific phosphodiesterase class I)/GGDEF domain-containing protein